MCDHLGTTRDHLLKLYNKLSDKYKTGQITKEQLRFAIRRLELKLWTQKKQLTGCFQKIILTEIIIKNIMVKKKMY